MHAKVSIGVPTYNGISHIRECLECLRSQTFKDFDVVICDNASNDGTTDVCAEFALRDARFKHIRSDHTISAGANFLKALEASEGSYFMWRADDDLSEPDYLRNLVKALDDTPTAALAVGPTIRINKKYVKSETVFPVSPPVSAEAVERVSETLLGCRPTWFYGLWRREAIVQAYRLSAQYPYLWALDHLIMLPAILNNATVLVPGSSFVQRITREPTYHLAPSEKLKARRLYKALAYKILDAGNWSPADRKKLNAAVSQHLELRVAPLVRTYRYAAKQKIRSWLRA